MVAARSFHRVFPFQALIRRNFLVRECSGLGYTHPQRLHQRTWGSCSSTQFQSSLLRGCFHSGASSKPLDRSARGRPFQCSGGGLALCALAGGVALWGFDASGRTAHALSPPKLAVEADAPLLRTGALVPGVQDSHHDQQDHAEQQGLERGPYRPFPWAQWLNYQFLKLLSAPSYGKIVTIMAISTPIIMAGGALYALSARISMREGLWRAYNVLANLPGTDIVNETRLGPTIALHSIFMVGLLTFAAVLGVVIDDFTTLMQEVRLGNFPLAESGHTVILGWNECLPPLLRQIALARQLHGARVFPSPVVVLANKSKAEMDDELYEVLEGLPLPVIMRQGHPSNLEDVNRVSASLAKTVVLLHSDLQDEDLVIAQEAAALAALKAAGGISGQNIVVQSLAGTATAARLTFDAFKARVNPSMVLIPSEDRLVRMLAQTAVRPGIERVMDDLLQYEPSETQGKEFYVTRKPELEGLTFGEARRRFPEACLVGIIHKGPAAVATSSSCSSSIGSQVLRFLGRRQEAGVSQLESVGLDELELAPHDQQVIAPGDSLVLVASGGASLTPRPQPYQVPPLDPSKLSPVPKRRARPVPQNLVVLSFDDEADALLLSMVEFAKPGSTVTLVARSPPSMTSLPGATLHYFPGNPADMELLMRAGVAAADTVVVTGLDHYSNQDADAQVLASMVQVQAAVAASGVARSQPLQVVALCETSSAYQVLDHITGKDWYLPNKEANRLRRQASGSTWMEARRSIAAGANRMMEPHLLSTQHLISGVVAQVAAQPLLNKVIRELFSATKGCEIQLRPPAFFGLHTDTSYYWSQVVEAARRDGRRSIVIGTLGAGGELELAPAAFSQVVLKPGTTLVAIDKRAP